MSPQSRSKAGEVAGTMVFLLKCSFAKGRKLMCCPPTTWGNEPQPAHANSMLHVVMLAREQSLPWQQNKCG